MNYYLYNPPVNNYYEALDSVELFKLYLKGLTGKDVKKQRREEPVKVKINVTITEEDAPKKKTSWCPFFQEKKKDVVKKSAKYPKALLNVYKYEQEKPAEILEKVTVHSNWVKIGWNSYDIYLDRWNNEFISLEDGTKFFVKTDRFGKRYLRSTA